MPLLSYAKPEFCIGLYIQLIYISNNLRTKLKLNSVALVREGTIQTERPNIYAHNVLFCSSWENETIFYLVANFGIVY
jgi:hypothetical protein